MTRFDGLRVGLVGPLPPPAGGMAMQTAQLEQLLLDAGAQVHLLQTNAPYRPAWVGKLPMLRAMARLLPYLLGLWRLAGRSDVMHVMSNSGWSWHLFAAPAIWTGWLRQVPVVVNYRGGEAAGFLERHAGLVRFSMARAAALCVPSGFLEPVFKAHGMAAEVLPNIVDLARFAPASRAPSVPRLLVARNLEAIYDNETAIRALAMVRQRHPDATLTVAGTGPQAGMLAHLVDELGLREHVHFVGRVERGQMAELLRESAIAINPSRVDNMPNSVLEALSSGVPVVSTAVGGVPYIVRDGETALLVPPGEPQAMAQAIMRLLEQPELARRLADAGRLNVRQYAWPQVAPRLLHIYRLAAARDASLSPCTRD